MTRLRLVLPCALLLTGTAALVAVAPPVEAAVYELDQDGGMLFSGDGPVNASPSPSTIEAYGMRGTITDVNVEIGDTFAEHMNDLDIEVVSPTGAAVVLLSDVCNDPSSAIFIILDDQSPGGGLDNSTSCAGTHKPSNQDGPGDEAWAVTPTGTTLAAFNGKNPNGVWRLYARDDNAGGHVSMIDGWHLHITTNPASEQLAVFPSSASATGSGVADPYPLKVPVSGLVGKVADVDLTLTGLSHTWPRDLDILLVSPGGTSAMVMSDDCTGALDHATLVLDDQAATSLTDAGPCPPGTYRPKDTNPGDAMPSPAPPGPYPGTLAAFNGVDPNGTWKVYIDDDGSNDTGSLTSLPQLTFKLTDVAPPDTTITSTPKSSTKRKATVSFVSSEAGSRFECQLDAKAYAPCASPLKLRKLKAGKHTLSVHAIDAAGNTDPTPAAVTWKVKKHKKK